MKASETGKPPYGACIVYEGKVIAAVYNRVWASGDPTAHAEVLAIQAASQRLSPEQLSKSTLYSTCEPCSMCLSACHWSGIATVVYAATMEDEVKFGLTESKTVPCRALNEQLGNRLEILGPLSRGRMLTVFETWLKERAALEV